MPASRRALLTTALLGACGSEQDFADALTPRRGYQRRQDIAYGAHPRQRLDVYRPEPARAEGPVALFLHGGSWNSGSKDQYRFLGEAFCARGITTVVANYRLYPEVRFPTFLEDAARAFAWLNAEGREALPRGSRVIVGHSAGAHMAMMLALDRRWLDAARAHPPAGVIGLAGPYDFALRGELLRAVFGGDDPAAGQPITFADRPGPPLLLQHGLADTVVLPVQSMRLAARRRDARQPVTLTTYADLGHIAIIGAIAAAVRWSAPPVLNDIADFVTSLG